MNFDRVMRLIGEWAGTMRFFPSDPDARLGLAKQLARMVGSEEQLRWLVETLPTLYSEWPGLRELRALYCMKFRPMDGIEVASEVYPDGLTREQLNPGMKELPAAPMLQLPPSEITTDPEMKELVVACADATGMRSFTWAPPREWTELEPGESELQGLIRVTRTLGKPHAEPRAATQSEIESIKAAQAANRSGQ